MFPLLGSGGLQQDQWMLSSSLFPPVLNNLRSGASILARALTSSDGFPLWRRLSSLAQPCLSVYPLHDFIPLDLPLLQPLPFGVLDPKERFLRIGSPSKDL